MAVLKTLKHAWALTVRRYTEPRLYSVSLHAPCLNHFEHSKARLNYTCIYIFPDLRTTGSQSDKGLTQEADFKLLD